MLATWRHTTTYTTEYLIPHGAPIGEFGKAAAVAWTQYCLAHGLNPDTARQFDNWATVTVDDEHVIIRFETDKPPSAAAPGGPGRGETGEQAGDARD